MFWGSRPGKRRSMMMQYNIRACTLEDIDILAEIIQVSFHDVAERFGLTPENSPRHPSNLRPDWLQRDMNRGITYYLLNKDDRNVGCAALEQVSNDLCYLERLAVIPPARRQGLGAALVNHVLAAAAAIGAERVEIGIIAEQKELKEWYGKLGFEEMESKDFSHLRFRVTFMRHYLGQHR
jgi:N-acetylglutamate synthase-like GNAT family acetyltransferase